MKLIKGLLFLIILVLNNCTNIARHTHTHKSQTNHHSKRKINKSSASSRDYPLIVDYYTLVTKENMKIHKLCKDSSNGQFAGIIDREISVYQDYFDLRTSQDDFEKSPSQKVYNDELQQFICVNKAYNPNVFISYRKPPVVVYEKDKNDFESKNGYVCSKGEKDEKNTFSSNTKKSYDLTEGGKFAKKKYLCVHYTTDKQDEGIREILIYPTPHKRKPKWQDCKTSNKFKIDNYECDCTDINEKIYDTYHMHICYLKGDKLN
jgi:hypothetical protein